MNSPKFFTIMVSIALATLGVVVLPSPAALAEELPQVTGVPAQPLRVQISWLMLADAVG